MQWPWVKRQALALARADAGVLRHRIRKLEEEKRELEQVAAGLRSQLTVVNLRAADALEHGYNMARGDPFPGGVVGGREVPRG